MNLLMASDGSGGDPRIAGYAAVVYNGSGNVTTYRGSVRDRKVTDATFDGNSMTLVYNDQYSKATNNRGELCGLLCAVMIAEYRNATRITVVVDSMYCINTFEKWLEKWIAEGTLNTKLNTDIIMLIRRKMVGIKVDFVHQRSHLTKIQKARLQEHEKLNVMLNEIADREAEYARLH
jgi:ribonuclease HI